MRSHSDMDPTMTIPEATMHTSHKTLFDTARTNGNVDVLISKCDAVFNDESEFWSGEGADGANDELNVEHENCPTERRSINNENLIVKEVKSAVKDLAANEMLTIIEESLDDILSKSLHNAQ